MEYRGADIISKPFRSDEMKDVLVQMLDVTDSTLSPRGNRLIVLH